MVDFRELKPEVVELNYATLKKLKISELQEMLKEHTWRGEVIPVDSDFKLLVKYVLEKKNELSN